MSYVYFAKVGKYVKIGFSYRPERRVKKLLSAGHLITPPDLSRRAKIRLIHTVPGCVVKDERRLHEVFAEWRAEGEWFRGTPEFMQALAQLDYVTLTDERATARRARALAKKQAEALPRAG